MRYFTSAFLLSIVLCLGSCAQQEAREPPPPAPPTDDAPPARSNAYWNTWFEYDDGSPQEALTVGNFYTFVLDLAPFDYDDLVSG